LKYTGGSLARASIGRILSRDLVLADRDVALLAVHLRTTVTISSSNAPDSIARDGLPVAVERVGDLFLARDAYS
jgi:hypothetical protein